MGREVSGGFEGCEDFWNRSVSGISGYRLMGRSV